VAGALDSPLHGHEFDSPLLQLVLGWVTVFWRANHLSISPIHTGQLSLLSSVGQDMSTSQSAVMLCGHFSISPSHAGQLSLLPSVGREMNTSQGAVMLRGWGVKAGMVHSICGQMCGWQVKLCDVLSNSTVAAYSVDSQKVLHYQRTTSTSTTPITQLATEDLHQNNCQKSLDESTTPSLSYHKKDEENTHCRNVVLAA